MIIKRHLNLYETSTHYFKKDWFLIILKIDINLRIPLYIPTLSRIENVQWPYMKTKLRKIR